MFERYTERARRAIFFARYEASVFGTLEITSEELLLGILREHKAVAPQLALGVVATIRKELEQLGPPKGERLPTSVDLPISHEVKRSLELAEEEAATLHHKQVDTPHLLLGLMRFEGNLAAELLRKHGLEIEAYREVVAEETVEQVLPERSLIRPAPWPEQEPIAAQSASLQPAIQTLQQLVENTVASIRGYPARYGDRKLKRNSWTRKEALGHLIDSAIAHRRRWNYGRR